MPNSRGQPSNVPELADDRLPDAPEADSILDFGRFKLALRRHWRMIAAIVAGALLAAAIALLVISPKYTATAILLVDPRQQRVLQSEAVLPGIGNDMGAVESQVELVQSATLARSVIAQLHLDRDPEFASVSVIGMLLDRVRVALGAEKADPKQRLLSKFAMNLQVKRRGLTYVLEIGFTSSNADKAASIANAIADAYLAGQVNVKFEATSKASTWLNARLSELREHAAAAERAVADYKAEHDLVDTGDRRTLVEQQIADLNQQLAQAQAYASDVEARYNQMRTVVASSAATGSLPEALQSQVILSLRNQYAQAAKSVADLAQALGPRHPTLKAARAELESVQSQIASELARIVGGLRNQKAAARGRERSLETRMAALRQTSADKDQANVRLRELEGEAQASRALLQQFLQRFKETTEQQSLQIPDARIVSPASPPQRPSFPNAAILFGLATVGGLVLGIGAALVADRFARSFRSVQEAETVLALPVIGLVPEVRPKDIQRRRTKSGQPPSLDAEAIAARAMRDFSVARPLSFFGDAIRNLAAQVRASDWNGSRVVLVTAAMPGEGTSTIAENLANVLARTGSSTLLIDANFHRPSGPRSLPAPGLYQILRDGNTPASVIRRDPGSRLFRLPAGRVDDPLEATAMVSGTNSELDALLARLRRMFDFIILDGSPILASDEGRELLACVDMALLVVAWARTDRQTVVSAVETAGLDSKFLGVVLNKVERESYNADHQDPHRLVA